MDLHVAEGKYNTKRSMAMVLLSEIPQGPEGSQTPAEALSVLGANPRAFLYSDVDRGLWEAFKATPFGPELDALWEMHFKGQHGEREITPIQFLVA